MYSKNKENYKETLISSTWQRYWCYNSETTICCLIEEMSKYIDDLGTWVLTMGNESLKYGTEEGSVAMSFIWRHWCELMLYTHTHTYSLALPTERAREHSHSN